MERQKASTKGTAKFWSGREIMRGFIVMSWMIQSFLCLLLVFLSFSLFMQWHKKVRSLHSRLNRFLASPIACDFLQRDIQAALPKDIQIDRYSVRLNLPSQHKKVTWVFDKDKFLRKQRIFDLKHKVWKKPVKNLVIEKLVAGSFEPIKNQKALLVGMKVVIKVEGSKQCQEYMIAFRNGKHI